MQVDIKAQKEGRYDVLQNDQGELLLMIKYRRGGPENPRFVYDGGDTALLYRSRESSILLDALDIQARKPLKMADEVLLVELDGEEVAREYVVPVRIVKNLNDLLK